VSVFTVSLPEGHVYLLSNGMRWVLSAWFLYRVFNRHFILSHL